MITVIACLLLAPAPKVQVFKVDGVDREALVYQGSATKPIVVLAFHGHGGGTWQASRSFDIHTIWPDATVVYPHGLPSVTPNDPQGKRNGWQVRQGTNGDRDLKFVDAILKSIGGIDPKRTFAMGHSNGGAMTYLLLAERRGKFAAFGPSGSPALHLMPKLKPAPFFHIAGENDRIVPYSGQKLTIERLQKLHGVDASKGAKSGYVTLYGDVLGTYIHPGGHEYPRPGAKATVEFFKKQLKALPTERTGN